MTNLKNYSNIFSDLAQGAYTERVKGKMLAKPNEQQQNDLKNKGYATYNFGDSTQAVYLQPDKTGHLTNQSAGYNAYFVTDQPSISDSQETYFVTRGSDGANLNNLNDWVFNNAMFTMGDAHIPQAKLAVTAMQETLQMLPPGAVMNVTGHSLGTMVSIQAVANLSESEISQLGQVVLFQGPDARASIEKMGEQAIANIAKLEAQGKIHYYVNAFDIVSMLNRNQKGVDEIGQVHYLLPTNLSYTSTFSGGNSSHDFGMYDFNSDGSIKEATLKDNPEIFEAGIKLSKLLRECVDELKRTYHLSESEAVNILTSASLQKGKYASIAGKFVYQYNKIISNASVAKKTEKRISSLKSSIKTSSGAKKLKLRSELVEMVAEKSKAYGKSYRSIIENELQEAEDEIDQLIKNVQEGAREIQHYLTPWEVEELIQQFQKERLWDAGQAEEIKRQAKAYDDKMNQFSQTLHTVSLGIQDYDSQAGGKLFQNDLNIQKKLRS